MDELRQKLNLNLYYVLIFVLSLLVLIVAPMFTPGNEVHISTLFPSSALGWAVYALTKLFVASINILLFHCFVKQARLNIKDSEKYKTACEILQKYLPEKYRPRSSEEYFKQLYRNKGTTVFITSVLSSVVLTNAIMAWDLTAFVTYFITIIMGLVFGVLKMKDVEAYWVGEFYDYAMKIKEEQEYGRHKAEH